MKTKLFLHSLIAITVAASAFGCGGGSGKNLAQKCVNGDYGACQKCADDDMCSACFEEDFACLTIQESSFSLDSSCPDVEFSDKVYTDGQYNAEKDECQWTGGEDTLSCPLKDGDCLTCPDNSTDCIREGTTSDLKAL